MRVLLALLLPGVALAQERAFVEATAPKDAYYVGEQVRLTLRFGYDREFFRTNAVPLFAREMEVPVQVQARLPGQPAPWPGTRYTGPRFALNDGVARSTSATEETRDGRVFAVLQLENDYTPREPGHVTIEAPALRYAYATVFEEDFVSGRVAKDPKQEVVTGEALTLRVLPLPEGGRPPGFEGAVGRFTVSAKASRTSLTEGETLRLSFAIRGDGNARTPELHLAGFHLLGTIRQLHSASYDLRPLSADVKEIPAIPFAFFDPGPPAGYRVVHTDPIPLEVRKRAAPEPPSLPPPQPRDSAPATAIVVVAVVVALAAVTALALLMRSRRRGALPPDPDTIRVQAALDALRARVGSHDHGLADAFAGFLAACLKCPPAAVIGPDLPARLVERGLTPGLASRAAATLERLVAARYGGGHVGGEDCAALLSEIEASLAPTGGGRRPT